MTIRIGAPALAVAVLVAGAVDASAYDRRVVVVNNTSTTIQEFYASNTGENDWQEDILGDDTLQPGGEMTVNIDDGSGACVYDFRAEFTNGQVLTRMNINVCQIADYYYTR